MENDKGGGTREFHPILRTKLHRPQLTPGLVNRARLITVMNAASQVPLTLIAAPAGYGKSVLASQWIQQLDSDIAWLSLDDSDSELRTFVEYFVAAVDSVLPGACKSTGELVAAARVLHEPVLTSYLLNDLDAIGAPCAIVLDDYHRIDPLSPVHDLMLRMLEHPPRQFRFIILTRQDPPFDLPRLRAGHRVYDVRLQDLRFTAPETGEFLDPTAELSISDETFTKLDREVEGWAAGLRLVSLALKNAPDPNVFLNQLHGSLPQIQQYLLLEVMGGQLAEIRNLLLESSILDRFCAELLDAMCEPPARDGHAGFTAAAFLDELRTNNLFTFSLDAHGQWFRYHHYFQDLLKTELQRVLGPDHVSALHLRASRWFENEGLIDEAIEHSLAAEDMERVVALVARHRHEALDADHWYVLEKWLSLIPDTVVQQHAELLMSRAWILLNYYFNVEAVPPLLDRIESLLGDGPGDENVRGELAASRGYLCWLMGSGAESLRYVDVALERIPLEHLDVRSNSEMVFLLAGQMVGQKAESLRFLDDLLVHSGSLHPLRKTRLLLASHVFLHLTSGDLLEAEVANRRLLTSFERDRSVYVRAWSNYLQGLIHLQRCEWEAAVEFLERSVARRFLHHARAAVDSMCSLMLAYQALGRKDEAQAALQTLNEYVAPLGDSAMERLALSAEVRLTILQGQLETARRWVEAGEPPPEGAFMWWLDIPSITRCRTMLAVGSPGGVVKAEAQLREFAEVAEAQHSTCQLIRVLPLLATAYARQDKMELALTTLERAVTLARQGDFVLPFVELGRPMVDLLTRLSPEDGFASEVERLVTAFGAPGDPPPAPKAEGYKGPERRRGAAGRKLEELTNRELDVLELLALRLQNKEIAARLGISSQTVGGHLKRLYHKLGVRNRRQAVKRASGRGILDRRPLPEQELKTS